MSKRTKIVCTIGPASKNQATLRAMIAAGMNVARLNFSHGTYQEHAALIKNIRAAAKAEHEPVALLQDLQGPKIRLGNLPKNGVVLKGRQRIVFQTDAKRFISGATPVFPVTYPHLHRDVRVGHRILIDDGLIEVKVTKIRGREILSQVVNGGMASSHKGMNFPDSTLSVSPITDKDRKDLAFGVRQGVDFVALSFVTSAKDIENLRKLITKVAGKTSPHARGGAMGGGRTMPRIIAKIEKHEAITHFDEILATADGIMVARGDLGVEIPAEEVPIRQKEIIKKCREAGKPVVVATQMLDSMTTHPHPTRAEVSDVANAVIDHADAVMLSSESATGSYPVRAVQMMAKIVARTETSPFDDLAVVNDSFGGFETLMSHALQALAAQGYIHGVLSATFLAPWCEQLNVSRPEAPFYLASDDPSRVRQMNICWGVRPFLSKKMPSTDFIKHALIYLRKERWIKSGTRLALVLGGEHGVGFDVIDV